MRNILFITFIHCALICPAQVQYQPYPHGRWCYDFTEDILANNGLRVDADPHVNSQSKCWMLSYINDYKTALAYWDSVVPGYHTSSPADSLYFLKFKPVKAKDYILERAKKEQIIIINEAHHQPAHRVFTESLLPELYKEGFRYFGAEAIGKNDSLLNARKFPSLLTGIYVHQPQYGNLIRTALQEGFYVFAYEAEAAKNVEEREPQQAQNIKRILDKDPRAKIVIHCGFDHLAETDLPGFGKPMAAYLKEITGIDPFTIDQVQFTEKSSVAYEDPFYKMIDLAYYAVFIDSQGKEFNGPPNANYYDVRVYHPRSQYKDGRPSWYFENGREPFFFGEEITIGYPCLLFAYDIAEDPTIAVPADIVELKSSEDKVALSLKRGTYVIVARNMKKREEYFKMTF